MACGLFGAKPISEPMLVILSTGPPRTLFSKILIKIQTYSFQKFHLKISSAKWRPFCLGLNVLNQTHRRGANFVRITGYILVRMTSRGGNDANKTLLWQ